MDDRLIQLAKAIADREIAIKLLNYNDSSILSIEIDKLMKSLPSYQQFVKLNNICVLRFGDQTIRLDLSLAVNLTNLPIGIPVLYEIDEDNEATGQTLRFCSDACAVKFDMDYLPESLRFDKSQWGREDGPQDKTEHCICCENPIG